MIKKYDNSYINLLKISIVTKIKVTPIEDENICAFEVYTDGGGKIEFEDASYERLSTFRDRLIKDWMEVVNGNKNPTA